MTTDIKDDGWNRWHQTSIKNIEVKNGEVEIGFILNGRPDTWGSIDDIEFYVQNKILIKLFLEKLDNFSFFCF